MSKANGWENDILELLFKNTTIANWGDATGLRGTTSAGSLFWSLHTADPGEAGTQTTSEAAYGAYARVATARSGAGFTVTNNSVSPAANVDFPQASSGSETETHFGIGRDTSAAGRLAYSGVIGSAPKPGTGDTADLFTAPVHGLTTDDRVIFEAIEGQTLPAGITAGTRYWVIAGGLTADAFKFSTTQSGGAVDITASGVAMCFKSLAIVVTTNVTPRLTTVSAITEG
jgi:hypothetical protein